MSEVLPIVRPGTYHSLKRSLVEYDEDKSFLLTYLDEIYAKNPWALKMMLDWTDDLEGDEWLNAMLGMAVLYRLLEWEIETTEFEKEMGVTNEEKIV